LNRLSWLRVRNKSSTAASFRSLGFAAVVVLASVCGGMSAEVRIGFDFDRGVNNY